MARRVGTRVGHIAKKERSVRAADVSLRLFGGTFCQHMTMRSTYRYSLAIRNDLYVTETEKPSSPTSRRRWTEYKIIDVEALFSSCILNSF